MDKFRKRLSTVVEHYYKVNGMEIVSEDFRSAINITLGDSHLIDVYPEVVEEMEKLVGQFADEVFNIRQLLIDIMHVNYPNANKIDVLNGGVEGFLEGDYSPFESPHHLATAVLGKEVKKISDSKFQDVVDLLPIPDQSHEKRVRCLEVLESYGIFDTNSLYTKGTKMLQETTFFQEVIPNLNPINFKGSLNKIAEYVGMDPLTIDLEMDIYKSWFNERGVYHWKALRRYFWIHRKEEANLPLNASFKDFGESIFGFDTKLGEDDMEIISDEIGLDENPKRQTIFYRDVLLSNMELQECKRLTDIRSLFLNSNFDPYGDPITFASFVLGRTIYNTVKKSELAEILRVLEVELHEDLYNEVEEILSNLKRTQNSEEENECSLDFRSAFLEEHSKLIEDEIELNDSEKQNEICRRILLNNMKVSKEMTPMESYNEFLHSDFPPFENPTQFASFVLNRNIEGVVNLVNLYELFEILDLHLADISMAMQQKKYRRTIDERNQIIELTPEQIEEFRGILINVGIEDRADLIGKGIEYFEEQDFGKYGKARAFIKAVTGVSFRDVSRKALFLVADQLNFSSDGEKWEAVRRKIEEPNKRIELTPEQIEEFRGILSAIGFNRRSDFLNKEVMYFKRQNFGKYGKSTAFAKAVTGISFKRVARSTLILIADQLGFSEDDESVKFMEKLDDGESRFSLIELTQDQKLEFKDILKSININDRIDLIYRGVGYFKEQNFGKYKTWKRFAKAVTGVAHSSTKGVLTLIGNQLDFPEITMREVKIRMRAGLRICSVYDKKMLMHKGVNWFAGATFEPFGTGRDVSKALGFPIHATMLVSDLEKVAEELSMQELSYNFVQKALSKVGVNDDDDLRTFGTEWFKNTTFDNIGKGRDFVKYVTGEKVKEKLNHIVLEDFIKKCGIKILSPEEQKQKYVMYMNENGIYTREDLLSMTFKEFQAMNFGMYGGGIGFISRVVGRRSTGENRHGPDTMLEIAGILFPLNQVA
ncbi:hypothetical protein JW758_01485 [Candidatus Peregrinibacteria bacterium]|nr:hypothetical protein [Candidatus Peregrinibacteria bacterium]